VVQPNDVESMLRQPQPGMPWPDEYGREFIAPRYDGFSLANVPATVAAVLGQTLPGSRPLAPLYWEPYAGGVRRVIVLLLDALGYLRLQQMMEREEHCVWKQLAQQGICYPMTSVCPSTTTTALSCLGTGVEPVSHGLVGYELWLREYGVIADMITPKASYGIGRETLVDWGFDADTFLPVPGLGSRFTELGICSTNLISSQYLSSSLSRMIYRGFTRTVGYSGAEDMWARLYNLVSRDDDQPGFYFCYWSTIDTAIHRYGSEGGYWQAELQSVSRAMQEQFLNRLTPADRRGTLFVMLADHGWVDTPIDQAHDVDTDAVLRAELLGPASGESRAAYLHCLRGDNPAALARIKDALGEDFVAVPAVDALRSGLLGTGTPMAEVAARIGHVMVFARGSRYLDKQGKRFRQRGRHGGLSPDEMLVPWLALRLDD